MGPAPKVELDPLKRHNPESQVPIQSLSASVWTETPGLQGVRRKQEIFVRNKRDWASESIQWVKALVAHLDNLSSIPRNLIKGEN